jgi:phosphatidylserine/phosphatidylglycerophosphate/cardiolipin synthase-like enzyme
VNKKETAELFIVDNSDAHWKALEYVAEWCKISKSIDIATGFFEIGALLALDGDWQQVDKLRILIGGDTTRQTTEAIRRASAAIEASFESAREADLFLTGVDAIVEGIRTGKIEIRVYRRKKFHAKTYITRARTDVIGSAALVGSSNFTRPGLTENIELNVRVLGREVEDLQAWFESYWNDAELCSEEILAVISRHARQFTPFDVYAKALHSLVKDVEPGLTEWESTSSNVYPVLSAYQKQHYHLLKHMAEVWGGGFLTDGVGLGKTLVGLMLAEFFASKGPGGQRNVLILATKTGVDAVWRPEIETYLGHLQGDFGNIILKSHTFLSRDDWYEQVQLLRERVDVVIIDEGHNFRVPGPIGEDPEMPKSRYRRLKMITSGKTVFHLTATPINNSVIDFLREIELFCPDDQRFAPLGIGSLTNYLFSIENDFLKSEREARKQGEDAAALIDVQEVRRKMTHDRLFGELVTQVGRKYAIESARLEGGEEVLFPEPSIPRAVSYEFSKANNKLLAEMEKAFAKKNPLFTLPMYYPLAFAKVADKDGRALNRQMQVVALIRTVFLKRFESSTAAFAGSVFDLTMKIIGWLDKYSPMVPGGTKRINKWRELHDDVLHEIFIDYRETDEVGDEDDSEDLYLPELDEIVEDQELDPDSFDLEKMVETAFDDLDQLKRFLEIIAHGGDDQDNKYETLKQLITDPTSDAFGVFGPEFVDQKVLIFTEFADTARYLHERLLQDGVPDVDRLDGSRKGDRLKMIQRFAPFYNKVKPHEFGNLKPIRVLVTTDVSEGVNLQDGSIIINYDLHWNPVRLIQRIGRVDRRRSPELERQILEKYPTLKKSRNTIFIRNFLPPKAIESLLRLQSRVETKTWRISVTLGIPSGQLLDKDDRFDDVKIFDNFKNQFYGELSPIERLRLKWMQLCNDNLGLAEHVARLPDGIGVAKSASEGEVPAVFACYQFPEPVVAEEQDEQVIRWRRTGRSPRWIMRTGEDISVDLLDIDSRISSSKAIGIKTASNRSKIAKTVAGERKELWDQVRRQNEVPLNAEQPLTVCWMELQ